MHQLLDQRARIDALEPGTQQLGVGAGGFADVVDQAVEPADVVAGDRHQPLAKLRVLDPVEPFDGRAQRGEGVLELVGDVRREGFDIVDPLAQRLAHVRHGAGEEPDLVAAGGEAGHVDLARSPQPHAVGGDGQSPQRPDDRSGEEDREEDRDCDQHRHRAGDEAALAADRARECAIVVGREQHAAARSGRRRK